MRSLSCDQNLLSIITFLDNDFLSLQFSSCCATCFFRFPTYSTRCWIDLLIACIFKLLVAAKDATILLYFYFLSSYTCKSPVPFVIICALKQLFASKSYLKLSTNLFKLHSSGNKVTKYHSSHVNCILGTVGPGHETLRK